MADTIESSDVPSVHGIVALNPDGSAIGTPVGGATSANQTNGTQKTQIVDSGGEAVTVTNGKLDVNASASLSGESIPATGATTAVTVQIVDDSGNQISSFGGGTQYTEDAAAASNPVGGALIMVRDDALSGQTSTDGDNVAARGTDKGELYVKHTDTVAVTQSGTWDEVGINDSGNSITVDNPQLSVVGSGTEATALRVTIATDSTGVVSIDDNGGAITVDGTVAVTGVATAANQTTVIGHLDGVETLLGTIDTDTGNVATSTASIDTKTPALGQALAAGSVPVVLTADQLSTLTPPAAITGFATAANQLPDGHNVTVDNASIAVTGTFWQATQPVSLASVPSHAVTNAGTFAVQNTAATPAGNNNIGDVDIASIAAGDNNIGNVDIASALPAGTNAIGKLAANSGVDIGDVTLTAGTEAVGKLLPPDVDVTTHTNYTKKYYTNSGAVTDGIIWSPAAGKRWHVVNLVINVSAAATVTLEDDKAGGDEVVAKFELAANSGVIIPYSEKYPLASGEDAADLLITTSAGNVYVTAVGYEI